MGAGHGAAFFIGRCGDGSGIALLVSAAVVSLRAVWTLTAVRVVGSWVAAIGMLMFGWLALGTG